MKEKFDYNDIALLAMEVPDDVKSLHYNGEFQKELVLLDRLIDSGRYGAPMNRRLKLQKFIAAGLDYSYTLSAADVIREVGEKYPAFDAAALDEVRELGFADYILKNGEYLYQNDAGANILGTCETYLRRLTEPEFTPVIGEDENLRMMMERGQRAFRYTVRESIAPADHAAREGAMFRAWLPFPAATAENSERRLLKASHPTTLCHGTNGTVYAEFPWAGVPYEIELSFVCRAVYHALSDDRAMDGHPGFYLGEEYPHIMFTPYLRSLAEEIVGRETNPLRKARRIYDYVTHYVKYSYVHEYRYFLNIPMFTALKGRGDCGVQAILFITLCRIAGVPARWQSGNRISPTSMGCHDWAQFYVEPWGWLPADLSYGGSAVRRGDAKKAAWYFGNLDPFRYICCTEFQRQLSPAKEYMRIEPYDNQSGEAEYTDMGLVLRDVCFRKQVLSGEEVL